MNRFIPLRLSLIAAIACLFASSLFAEAAQPVLAKAFPRTSILFYEMKNNEEIRKSMSREALLKEGISEKVIESFMSYMSNMVRGYLGSDMSAADAEKLVYEWDSFAFGISDVAIADTGNPSDFVKMRMVVKHRRAELIARVMKEARKAGSPNIVKHEATSGIDLFQIKPNVKALMQGQPAAQELPDEVQEIFDGFFSGFIGVSSDGWVVYANRRTHVLDAIDGLNGDIEVPDTLAGNKRFKQTVAAGNEMTMSWGFLAFKPLISLISKLPNAEEIMESFELNTFDAAGTTADYFVSKGMMVSRSEVFFKGDKVPGWLKPFQGSAASQKLLALAPEGAILRMWSGLGDHGKRLGMLIDFFVTQAEVAAKAAELKRFLDRPLNDLKSADGRKGIEEIKSLLSHFGNEQLVCFGLDAEQLQRDPSKAIHWIAASTISADKSATIVDDLLGRVPDAAITKVGEAEKGEDFVKYTLAAGERYRFTALVSGTTLLIGTDDWVQDSLGRLRSGTKADYTIPNGNTFAMEFFYGQMIDAFSMMFMAMDVPQGAGGEMEQAEGMMNLLKGIYGKMKVRFSSRVTDSSIIGDGVIEGLPKPASMATFVYEMNRMMESAASTANMVSIVSGVKLAHVLNDEWPEKLTELDMVGIEASSLKDPLSHDKDEASSYTYIKPTKNDADEKSRLLVLYQTKALMTGNLHLVCFLNGETAELSADELATAKKLAAEGKPYPAK